MANSMEIFAVKGPLQRAGVGWEHADAEPFLGETLLADGWRYVDLPRMRPNLFDQFIEIVGAKNISWLTLADYGDTKRGQCLISPAGLARLTASPIKE